MVRRFALAIGLLAFAGAPAGAADTDLSQWAMNLPERFTLSGSKVEPTYVAAIDISRDGDVVSILGGAPAWAERSREAVAIDAGGAMRHVVCPNGMTCNSPPTPAGLLSTAALISRSRAGTLHASIKAEPYGHFSVLCVPAEMLGISRPILDPCFEVTTGAAIAQKNRFSNRFDGPSLDPVTLTFATDNATKSPKEPAP
ncbi:hypothetical protein [Mesorhizobium sp. J428]|uniref:hypothetical protein n=1 Tax=Mesorhizobium sp. J428 TaxID=2898440 RepID=UPI002150CFA6|nr:hypothetical protein [Mesorhizobium sp. J428]MCR5856235.1 hypothetical protein [Mesorhizobium sp. J428]